jgi:hypothetical protein
MMNPKRLIGIHHSSFIIHHFFSLSAPKTFSQAASFLAKVTA